MGRMGGLRALQSPLGPALRAAASRGSAAAAAALTSGACLDATSLPGPLLHSLHHCMTSATVPRSCPGAEVSSGFFIRGFSAAIEEYSRADDLKRLLYRAKQRGVLELDLLVGGWAQAHIGTLSDKQLNDLRLVLDQESPDLLQWLLGQAAPPAEVAANEVFQSIKSQVSQSLIEHWNPKTAAKPGSVWVKGWEDIGKSTLRAVGLPPVGNQ